MMMSRQHLRGVERSTLMFQVGEALSHYFGSVLTQVLSLPIFIIMVIISFLAVNAGRIQLLHCTQLESAPEEIFYDFACYLCEYTLNRENGFYTRMFHDVLHGFSHRCGKTYQSSRLVSFDSVNSEVCEHFNTFMQCINSLRHRCLSNLLRSTINSSSTKV